MLDPFKLLLLTVILLWPLYYFILGIIYHRVFLGGWPKGKIAGIFLGFSLLSALLGVLHLTMLLNGSLFLSLLFLALWIATLSWITPEVENRAMIKDGVYEKEYSAGKLQELAGLGIVTLLLSYISGFLFLAMGQAGT